MAVPTISTISPSSGLTMGRELIEITGTNFRLPTPPPATGRAPRPAPSVKVTIDGRACTRVGVISATRLICLVPAGDAGAADVVVMNIDDSGVLIPGETATLEDGYTYARPDLTVQSDFQRAIRTLVLELQRQVLANVVVVTNVDYDNSSGDSLNIIETATLPVLILTPLEVPENRFFSENERRAYDEANDEFGKRRTPRTVDIEFRLDGTADLMTEALNLFAAVQMFFNRNTKLVMDRDESDASKGTVAYEMAVPLDSTFRMTESVKESNLSSFTGTFVVRGFNFEDAIVDRGKKTEDTANAVDLQSEQIGEAP